MEGQVILGELFLNRLFKQIQNVVFFLGRKPPEFNYDNQSYHYYDFQKMDQIGDKHWNLNLLLNLSGPIKKYDGVVLRQCIKAGIPYMDIAMHNSHIETTKSICKSDTNAVALMHFGVFPGLSNLLIAKGFEMQNQKSGILVNEFPSYAGGGKNVSTSLKDILNESYPQKNIGDPPDSKFMMHTITKQFNWNKQRKIFFKWEYPEIESFLHSNPDTMKLERYFRIKPEWTNRFFRILIKLWNSPLRGFLSNTIPISLYFLKATFFKRNDPPFQMNFYDEKGEKALIVLKVKKSIHFHGEIMASFIKEFLKKDIESGIYTPEELFSLEEILPDGKFNNYELMFF